MVVPQAVRLWFSGRTPNHPTKRRKEDEVEMSMEPP